MITPYHSRRHIFSEDYFDAIDTEPKAYWLGFLYADGANCDKARNVSLSLAEVDRDHIVRFQRVIDSDHKIFVKHSSGFAGSPIHCLVLHSTYLCASLARQGCTPRKSLTLQFPTPEQVPPHLLRHFVRGYFDGDGSFYTSHRRGKVTTTGYVSIGSSRAFCDALREVVNGVMPIGGVVKRHKCKSGQEVFYYNLNGAKQVIGFMDWIYDSATVYLPRKREKYREFLVQRNQTMPARFVRSYVPHATDWATLESLAVGV